MSDKSPIEWLGGGATWNPILGCTPASAGCAHCYAVRTTWRLSHNPCKTISGPRAGLVEKTNSGALRWTGKIAQVGSGWLRGSALDEPLHWRKWRNVFVCSQSDLFHEDVPDKLIDEVFARILATRVFDELPRHAFWILTKRSRRMRNYLSVAPVDLLKRWARAGDGQIIVGDGDEWFSECVGAHCAAAWDAEGRATTPVEPWSHPELLFPLRGVRLYVSTENQETFDARVADLLATPADVRGVSAEPLLGPIDARPHLPCRRCGGAGSVEVPGGGKPCGACLDWAQGNPTRGPYLDHVIVGGESGPGARPCHVDWIRSILRQCRGAKVPAFVKQLGACYSDPADGIAGRALQVPEEAAALVGRRLRDRKGADPAEWPPDLRVREMPEASHG